jgi:hypothetical protein
MGGNRFDQLVQEILKQKQLMDALEAENSELRQQIADLGSGRGIFVDIYGTRFALRDDSSLVQTIHASSTPVSTSPLKSAVAASAPSVTRPLNQHMVGTPTEEIPQIPFPLQEQSVIEPVSPSHNEGDQIATREESTFLEEILIDGFANALTSPNATWQEPVDKKPAKPQGKPEESINEKQKEVLRRELLGSFLLE